MRVRAAQGNCNVSTLWTSIAELVFDKSPDRRASLNVVIGANKTAMLGAWWGFADADPVVVGVVVAALSALALSFVAMRVLRRSRVKKD